MSGLAYNDDYELHRGTDARLLDGFLRRYLLQATSYRRAAGFFSSSVFGAAFDEFVRFFRQGGTVELVCSPFFSEEDLNALKVGLYDRHIAPGTLEDVQRQAVFIRGRSLLSWALATGQLNVRIAVINGRTRNAIYHEKIGLLAIPNFLVAFEGSANESISGYVSNFERIIVYRTLLHVRAWSMARTIESDFERLWKDCTPGVTVHSLHTAFAKGMLQVRKDAESGSKRPDPGPSRRRMSTPAEILRLPPRVTLRPYQQEAIRAWFAQGGFGIYSMATGAGKTITALATVEQLFQRVGGPLVIIVVAPYLNLVDQWLAEAREFGLDPINCSGASRDWISIVDNAIYLNRTLERPILSLVTTNATFASEPFQRVLSRLRVRTVLIADEVHNLGARYLRRSLPDRIQLRLGLSATPERWMDEEGTTAVKTYFGKVVFSFDLKDAIGSPTPVLAPYVYRPVLVELEDDEREEYLQITTLLARYINTPHDENLSDAALSLLLRRARLVACARGKLDALRAVMSPYRTTRYNLVYCGDGRIEVEATSGGAAGAVSEAPILAQVHAVTQILGLELGMNVATYTAETSREARREILSEFEEGDKQALVAIRCLDEGVDIPQVRRAFILASSTNPRQFIQRRGRVLRRAEGKDYAEIFDFVVVPPINVLDSESAEYRVLRNLVSREMARVVEFARLATNGPQATAVLRPLLTELRLMHLG